MPSFVCNARYFLVTYAQCGDLSHWDVLGLFGRLGAECIIGRENHADGGIHLHVFADFGRKYRSRRVDIFDVGGHHPNISPSAGTPEKGYDYAIKDGDVVAGGLERPSGGSDRGSGDKWSRIAGAPTREEFFALCEELDPRSLCTSFTSLQRFADWKYRPAPVEYEHPREFVLDEGEVDGRLGWVQQAGIGHSEPRLGK